MTDHPMAKSLSGAPLGGALELSLYFPPGYHSTIFFLGVPSAAGVA